MKWFAGFFCIIYTCVGFAQTDETIFREFQFDFSTPGARANAMGRAFVGLSDEATAAYNNPAGLSVLNAPEFSIEYRDTRSRFDALEPNEKFQLLDGDPERKVVDLQGATFVSFSVSKYKFNFSIFFVNHLDYRRPETNEETFWEEVQDYFDTFNYLNAHEVKQILIETYGFSVSRRIGKWSLGFSFGYSNLKLDYTYETKLSSDDFPFSDLVDSRAQHDSLKPTYVLGILYQAHPKLKLALSIKKQPRFSYQELVITKAFPEAEAIPVQFKVPDSYQIGLAFQPNDFWTWLFELDWVRYRQLSSSGFTVISSIDRGPGRELFQFDAEDYKNNDGVGLRTGIEYLYPRGKNIFAFRGGLFTDPDHKTRFDATPVEGVDPKIYEIQDFIFNTGEGGTDLGHTLGIGYVRNNKFQLDLAYVETQRFRWLVSSFLYRF